MNEIETLEYNGRMVEIVADEDPIDPINDDDGFAVFVCFHKRYNLGTKNHGYKSSDFSSWDELESAIIKNEKPTVILPIYMYDHSGIAISTSPFSCPWDSGQIGFVYATPKMIKEWYGVKSINGAIKARVKKDLESQVVTYDQYLGGDIYGLLLKDEDGNDLENEDASWGIYGLNEARKEAEAIIERWKNEPEKTIPPKDIEGQQVMTL